MTSPIWLIESSVFGTSSEPFKAEIRQQGMAYEVLHPRPFLNGVAPEVAGRRLRQHECVIFWGTYPLMRHIQLTYDWVPGGWCNTPKFDCTRYYPVFGDHMLNSDHRILHVEDAIGQCDVIYDQYSESGQVFFRPCSLEKTFTGRCVNSGDYSWALESVRHTGCEILVARPRRIGREWRLVISDGYVVAASQYRINGTLCVSAGCPKEVRSFAEEALASTNWRPDPMFMLDICESQDALHVLEANSFSCSGMYASDPRGVIEAARMHAVATAES